MAHRRQGWAAAGLVAATLATAGAAQASPFKTLDPEAATSWEIKVEAGLQWDSAEQTVEGPTLDVTAPLRPGLESSLSLGHGWSKVKGEESVSGMLDAEWAVKWEVIPYAEADRRITISTEPALVAPIGSRGLTEDAWRVEVPVVFVRRFDKLELSAMAGYGQSLSSETDGEIPYGVLATYAVRDNFEIGVEFTGDAPTRDLNAYKAVVDAGFKWELVPGLELQGRIGRTVRSRPGEPASTQVAFFLEKAL